VRTNEATAYQVASRIARDHERLARFFEDISHASHCLDQFLLERVVHFGPEPPHVHINQVGMAVKIHVPNLARNDGPSQNFSFSSGQECKQRELLGSEVQTFASPGGSVLEEINDQVLDLCGVRLACRAT